MPILQTFKCDIRGCSNRYVETEFNTGAQGWGELHGVTVNGSTPPLLCPTHLAVLLEFITDVMEMNQ